MVINAFEEIRTWLNGRQDYVAGCKLYRSYGDIESLNELFTRGPTPQLRQKLFDRLKAIYLAIKERRNPESPALISEESPESLASNFKESPEWHELDKTRSRLFNEMLMYFNQLDLMKDESPECRDACLRILDLEDDYEQARKDLKYFEEHGELPAAVVPISTAEEASALKQLMRLRPNITKAKKLLPTLEGKRMEDKKQKLSEWERERDKLEKALGIGKK